MEDQAIIELFFARDERAIAETQAKYGRYCRSIAYNLLASHGDADEICQDALHALWGSIPPDRPQSLRCYIGRVARNMAISRYRSEHAKKRCAPAGELISELADCLPAEGSVEDALMARELAGYINSWLACLKRRDRAVFVLRFWHGASVAEIAQALGESPGRVSQTLFRLKKGLRGYLNEKGAAE